LPRSIVPVANFSRVKNQVLDRIAVVKASEEAEKSWLASFSPNFLRIARVTAGVLGTFLIVVSLTVGTAVASLQSMPGQTLYPLKKIVESVQLRMTSDQTQKANLQIKFASTRLEELEQVLERGQNGQISAQEVQKIVTNTIQDLKTSTAAAVKVSVEQPKVAIVSKLTDLSNKLKTASIASEGEVKLELEKALQATRVSTDEAIKNIERAGLKVENQPITIENPDEVNATGKLTAVSETSVGIGTAKFLLTKDTKYVKVEVKDLKIEQVVEIKGQVKDGKTYATTVTLISEPKVEGTDTEKSNDIVPIPIDETENPAIPPTQ
jgi:hypothetical protein